MAKTVVNRIGSERQEIGLIAEEVNKIIPEIVILDEHGSVNSLEYSRLTALLIEAIKEINEKVSKLEGK